MDLPPDRAGGGSREEFTATATHLEMMSSGETKTVCTLFFLLLLSSKSRSHGCSFSTLATVWNCRVVFVPYLEQHALKKVGPHLDLDTGLHHRLELPQTVTKPQNLSKS